MTLEKHELARFAEFIGSTLTLSADPVAKLLQFIDCHAELKGLLRIAENLIPILDLFDGIVTDEIELWPSKIAQWQTICRYISENAKFIETIFPEIDGSSCSRPFSKEIEKYPLYVSLWFRHPEETMQCRYRLLQAHLLLTQFHFRWLTENEDKQYESTTRESTRLIRQFADNNKLSKFQALQPLLSAMPNERLCMEAFLEHIYSLQGDTQFGSDVFKHTLDVLRRMLWYANEHRGGFSRRNSRTWEAIQKREAIRIPIIESDPDDLPNAFVIESILMPSQTEEEERVAKRAGCAPGEVKTGVEHFIISDETVTDEERKINYLAGRSPAAHMRRIRNKQGAVAIANQMLPTQWSRLTLQELAVFHSCVSDLTRAEGRGMACRYSDHISNRELAAVFTAIYWTGNDLNAVVNYRFCKVREDLPKVENLEPNDFRFVYDSEEWVHGPLRPDYKSSLKEQTKVFLNDTANYIVLPIRNGTAGILRRCLIGRVDEAKKRWRSKRIFEEPIEIYEAAVRTFLKSLNKKYKIRLTQTRLANDLFQRLYQFSGDIVEAMLITGRTHYLGMVPLHYSSPTVHRLQAVYQGTCQSIGDEIYMALEKPAKEAKPNAAQLSEEEAIGQHTGGRHYLIKGMVSKLIDGEHGLIQRFNESLKFSGFNDYLVNLHNDYTLYATEMLGFSTGYRAVRDPLDSLAQLDWETGFACISDKDDLDYYNARLVWIPHLVRDQLSNYQRHCRLLGERLILINPPLAKKLLVHGDAPDEDVPFLFLLRANGRLLNLRPIEIDRRLRHVFPVPVNANRSYLRNRLRELNCPGEMINYFLGHWENGEEPFGPYSTLSPMAFKQIIAPLLEQILKEDGWRVVVGLGRA